MAAVGVFLPWALIDDLAVTGLQYGDGRLLLVLAAAVLFLSQTRVRWVWVPAGFATVVAARQLMIIVDTPGVAVGIGILVSLLGFAVATALLLRELMRGILREGPAEPR
jgi:O-antigen ligase